jgi:ribosomal protein L37AE/L43A
VETPVTEPETEKYGVEEDDDASKTAAAGVKKCPTCGGELRPIEVTGVLLCAKCGSKPFEAKEYAPKSPR